MRFGASALNTPDSIDRAPHAPTAAPMFTVDPSHRCRELHYAPTHEISRNLSLASLMGPPVRQWDGTASGVRSGMATR